MNELKEADNPQPEAEEPKEHKSWWRHRRVKWIVLGVCIVTLLLLLIARFAGSRNQYDSSPAKLTKGESGKVAITESDAIKEGKALSNNQCKSEGVPYKLSASPMKPEDFSIVIPYGLMVGGHVTPIDHQYFSPKDY